MLITAADPRRFKARATVPVMRKPFEVDELIRVVSHHRPVAAAVDHRRRSARPPERAVAPRPQMVAARSVSAATDSRGLPA